MTSAVVFGYHNVGVRCLSVLLAHGVRVPLVVTHEDDPHENLWFGSVRRLAELNRIPVVMPDDPNAPEFVERIAALEPDFLFSFYAVADRAPRVYPWVNEPGGDNYRRRFLNPDVRQDSGQFRMEL